MNSNKTEKIITLDVFSDLISAGYAKNELKKNGIKSFLKDKINFHQHPVGEIELKVASKDLKKSFNILSK